MTKRLSRDHFSLCELLKLAKVREQTSLAELAQGQAALEQLKAEMFELETKEFLSHSAEDASRISKWQLWRRHELSRLQTVYAKAAAAHQETVKRCGRAVAEKSVLLRLQKQSASKVKLEHQRRSSTSPDEQYR